MKKLLLTMLVLTTLYFAQGVQAQAMQKQFNGATANLKHYKALYVINSNDTKKITGTLRNISNALEDPRLKGKLEVELIAFGDGVAVYEKSGTFESSLKSLQEKGVLLAECENTVRERHIDKNDLFPFISYVPSGNGEIIIRHYQGWAVVHP
jgi:intracellular sulfur oxidation DsrE/DsrF family protein